MENVFGAEDAAAAQAEAEAAVTNEMAVEGTDGAVPEEAGNIEVQTAGRTKVFTYTISESGSLPGVTNEQTTKTVEVTVTDQGGGALNSSSDKRLQRGHRLENDFTFTNTYGVNSAGIHTDRRGRCNHQKRF